MPLPIFLWIRTEATFVIGTEKEGVDALSSIFSDPKDIGGSVDIYYK